MKKWIVSFEIHDDGIEDETSEIKGKYFSKRDLVRCINPIQTAGLTLHNLTIKENE